MAGGELSNRGLFDKGLSWREKLSFPVKQFSSLSDGNFVSCLIGGRDFEFRHFSPLEKPLRDLTKRKMTFPSLFLLFFYTYSFPYQSRLNQGKSVSGLEYKIVPRHGPLPREILTLCSIWGGTTGSFGESSSDLTFSHIYMYKDMPATKFSFRTIRHFLRPCTPICLRAVVLNLFPFIVLRLTG